MTVQRQIDQLRIQRASEWLEVLKSGDTQQHSAFIHWITESPRHVEEFLALVALDRELQSSDLKERFDLDTLIANSSPPVTEISPPRRPPAGQKPAPVRAWKWTAGVAAAVLLLTVSVLLMRGSFSPWRSFETARGEQRAVELADGSVIDINAQSIVEVRLGAQTRDVRLLSGEALFKVARDARRPFRVHTRDALVQAVGTEFNVYARTDSTTVSVLEGKVQVSTPNEPATPAALDAGQAARIDPVGRIQRDARAVVANAVAWRQRRLVFDRTPLEDMVREFNRYNRSMQLRLEGIASGSRHYSGNFDADDPQSLGALLSKEQDLSVERREGELVIRARPTRDGPGSAAADTGN
jgi:transmembrane sensor